MSAWPEAIYIINKINYALNAYLDINQTGIDNINDLNNRIDDLNDQINREEPKGLLLQQQDVQNVLNNLLNSLDAFSDNYETVNDILQDFIDDLEDAKHKIVYIKTINEMQTLTDISEDTVVLIKE